MYFRKNIFYCYVYWVEECAPQNLISFLDYQNVAFFEMGSLQT